jgi:hypothetical protein
MKGRPKGEESSFLVFSSFLRPHRFLPTADSPHSGGWSTRGPRTRPGSGGARARRRSGRVPRGADTWSRPRTRRLCRGTSPRGRSPRRGSGPRWPRRTSGEGLRPQANLGNLQARPSQPPMVHCSSRRSRGCPRTRTDPSILTGDAYEQPVASPRPENRPRGCPEACRPAARRLGLPGHPPRDGSCMAPPALLGLGSRPGRATFLILSSQVAALKTLTASSDGESS